MFLFTFFIKRGWRGICTAWLHKRAHGLHCTYAGPTTHPSDNLFYSSDEYENVGTGPSSYKRQIAHKKGNILRQ